MTQGTLKWKGSFRVHPNWVTLRHPTATSEAQTWARQHPLAEGILIHGEERSSDLLAENSSSSKINEFPLFWMKIWDAHHFISYSQHFVPLRPNYFDKGVHLTWKLLP